MLARLKRRYKIALLAAIVLAPLAIAWAANGPYPSVGLYWLDNTDPTAGGGMSAPLNQLLIRTDTPSLYYKSGAANTAWTRIGAGAGGGTVTSITCGTGLSCSPGNPITTSGTITATGALSPQNFTYTVTGAEPGFGTGAITVTLPAARASTTYTVFCSDAGKIDTTHVECWSPTSGQTLTTIAIDTSSPEAIGDKINILVQDRTP